MYSSLISGCLISSSFSYFFLSFSFLVSFLILHDSYIARESALHFQSHVRNHILSLWWYCISLDICLIDNDWCEVWLDLLIAFARSSYNYVLILSLHDWVSLWYYLTFSFPLFHAFLIIVLILLFIFVICVDFNLWYERVYSFLSFSRAGFFISMSTFSFSSIFI